MNYKLIQLIIINNSINILLLQRAHLHLYHHYININDGYRLAERE